MPGISPQDIIADDADSITANGTVIRKGTVAAFLANTAVLENPSSTQEYKQQALQALRQLAPAVIATGLHGYVMFKNSVVEQILIDAAHAKQPGH